jgi:hypothetical protein
VVYKAGLPLVFYHSLEILKVHTQSSGMTRYSSLAIGNMERTTRTSAHLTIVVNDATLHGIRPVREDTRWSLLRLKDLGIRLWTGSVRSNHFLSLINFKDVNADHSRRVEPSVPLIPRRLTTWRYRTPETTVWLTIKVIRTLRSRQRSARIMLVIRSRTCT